MSLFDALGGGQSRARDRARERRRAECGGGYVDLSPVEVAPIFARVTGIPDQGFQEIRSGWWAREAAPGIVLLLQFLRNSRGYDYRFRWGVSLAWVPHASGRSVRWCRTVRSARFALWDQAYDYLIWRTTDWQEADAYYPDRSLGATCFEEDLRVCWDRLRRPIDAWWQEATTPEGVLERASEQHRRVWEGALHAPDPALVAAFTQAHMGRRDEAYTWAADSRDFAGYAALLRPALERVAAGDA